VPQPQWAAPPAAPAGQPQWGAPQPAPGAPDAPAYPGGQYPPYAGPPAGPGAAPGSGIKVTPRLLAIGGVALAIVVVAIVVVMSMGSSSSGGITISPNNYSCTSTNSVTITIKLPASLKETDRLTWQIDGKTLSTLAVSDLFTKQPDGSWQYTDTSTGASGCAGITGMGPHTIAFLDASGHVLAQGSFTVSP
jgi:hypothetical protein